MIFISYIGFSHYVRVARNALHTSVAVLYAETRIIAHQLRILPKLAGSVTEEKLNLTWGVQNFTFWKRMACIRLISNVIWRKSSEKCSS